MRFIGGKKIFGRERAEYWMRRWDHAETDVYVSDDRPNSARFSGTACVTHSGFLCFCCVDAVAIKETSGTHFRVGICVSGTNLMELVTKRIAQLFVLIRIRSTQIRKNLRPWEDYWIYTPYEIMKASFFIFHT